MQRFVPVAAILHQVPVASVASVAGPARIAVLAPVGRVQKADNLTLDFNVVIPDMATRAQVFAGRVDIRDDTDESRQHGIRHLLKNRPLKEWQHAGAAADKKVLPARHLP